MEQPKTRKATSLATLAFIFIVTCTPGPISAQETPTIANNESPMAACAKLEGTWIAKGNGFSSTLNYEWVFPNVLLRATNELKNDAGDVIGQYEGHYVWDADQSKIIFWTVSKRGELHKGTATWNDGKLWHEATISGGRIEGYRSAITVTESEMEYRAQYKPDATNKEIESSEPLFYIKQ